jgi:hypothetical protein
LLRLKSTNYNLFQHLNRMKVGNRIAQSMEDDFDTPNVDFVESFSMKAEKDPTRFDYSDPIRQMFARNKVNQIKLGLIKPKTSPKPREPSTSQLWRKIISLWNEMIEFYTEIHQAKDKDRKGNLRYLIDTNWEKIEYTWQSIRYATNEMQESMRSMEWQMLEMNEGMK